MYTVSIEKWILGQTVVIEKLHYDDLSLANAAMDGLQTSDCFTSDNVIYLKQDESTLRIVGFTWQNGDIVAYSENVVKAT